MIGKVTRLLMEMEDNGLKDRMKRDVLREIISVHCSMAGLVNLTDRILRAADEGENMTELLEREKQKRASDLSKLVGNAVEKTLSASRIVTISNSSTIIEILTASHQKGAAKEIVISEARPAMEGRLAARELASKGLKVTMVADGALPQETKWADIVLVGADSVTDQGVVNKIGTLGVVSAAGETGVPSISAFNIDKLIASGYSPFTRVPHPPVELMEPERGIDVLNYYFDETPLELFTSFMTEEGELESSDVLERIGQKELHPELTEILVEK